MVINRMNDYFVKYLLGRDQNKLLCLSFVNAALSNERQYFTDIIFVNKDEDPNKEDDKPSLIVLCLTIYILFSLKLKN